jgi:uncharacterized RDD family membrane protein YckC
MTSSDPQARRALLEEQTYTIETPEHVEIVYTVAGPGSRLLAFVIDFLIMLVPAVVLVVILIIAISAIMGSSIKDYLEDPTRSQDFLIWLILAFITMAQFLVSQFYFVVFELAWNGQSPGKRWLGIRVIRDSGQPVGLYASMIRNLLRIADLLPLFYLAGFITMLATRHWRRLGDLAAGSIAVKVDRKELGDVDEAAAQAAGSLEALKGEVGAAWPPADPEAVDPWLEERFTQGGLLRLDPAFFDVAERFMMRRHQLEPVAAVNLAEKIARPAMERLGIASVQPERFIEQAIAFKRKQG